MVRNLVPLVDYCISEAFAAAHRYTLSLMGFAEVPPGAGDRLFMEDSA
ncbi:MAG: phosphoglycerate kinase [Anaerolineales bacterium]|nr:MAG: phosphoglycerate kinase [Anaerolineales bacterium]